MDDSIFDKVEKKTNVKKEDILKLAKSISGKDLNDENNGWKTEVESLDNIKSYLIIVIFMQL